jgi:alkylation response protein AidB-like acyl-CoA dehydrogenase
MQHAKQREQFGESSQFQAIRHKLADMAVDIEVARWLTYKSAIEYDGERSIPDSLHYPIRGREDWYGGR